MPRQTSKQAAALARARERRRELDQERDEKDSRIEAAAADVLVALDGRGEVERALESATALAGQALRVLLAEDVSPERAADLLELDLAEVRRLVKAGQPPASSGPAPDAAATTG